MSLLASAAVGPARSGDTDRAIWRSPDSARASSRRSFWTIWPWRSARESSSRSWAHRAAARPRCCGSSRDCSGPTAATSWSTAGTSPRSRLIAGASASCFRTTHSFRISPWQRTSPSVLGCRGRRAPRSPPRCSASSEWSGSRSTPSDRSPRSRGASSSVSPSPARSPPGRRCCCSTSRSARSIGSFARRWRSSSASCCGSSASRRSS